MRRSTAQLILRASLLVVASAFASHGVLAQAPPRRAAAATAKPDLGGFWYFGTATPLERPRDLADKATLTEEEAAAFETRTADRLSRVVAVHPPEWLDYGTKVQPDRRTSLIIDPPDGRIPALTAEARERAAARARVETRADNPEDRSPQERCLTFGAGPPVVPGPYNNNLQIVQTAGALMIFTEMVHDARIIPLDGRPQPPPRIRQWLGSSRGHWDGATLVIETTNFHDQVSFHGSDAQLKVIERLTLESADALRYEYTIDDPTAFTRPWTAAFTMTRSDAPLYEYACHEGNYGLMNTLQFERLAEKERVR